MKAQMNGAIVIATSDGAIPESVIFQGKEKQSQKANGFEVPYVNGQPRVDGLLKALKQLQQALKDPAEQVAMIRAAFAAAAQVDVTRTVQETLPFYQSILTQAVATK